jgi:hypothetical protein
MDSEGLMALDSYLRHYIPRHPRHCGWRGRKGALIRAPLLALATYRGPPRT